MCVCGGGGVETFLKKKYSLLAVEMKKDSFLLLGWEKCVGHIVK